MLFTYILSRAKPFLSHYPSVPFCCKIQLYHHERIVALSYTKIKLHLKRHTQATRNDLPTKRTATYHLPIMMHLHQTFTNNSSNYGDAMIWAASCLVYFGLLRVSELTSSADDHFNPSMDLLLSDVTLDNRASPSLIQITIKHSKGDQFRKGERICLGKSTYAVCLVRALMKYLARRGGTPGPLFVWPNNKALTRGSAINKAY